MYVDETIAKEITKVKPGGFFEHKKVKYDVVDNRFLIEQNQFELVIEFEHTYFVTNYDYSNDELNNEIVVFNSVENDKVKLIPMVREVRLVHDYKQPKDAKDIFDVDAVNDITKKLVEGRAMVQINPEYSLISRVVNRKNGTKIEAEVYKNQGAIDTRDIVNMEAFLKVMEKVYVLDFNIDFGFKKHVPMLVLKMNIGYEKMDWNQPQLFDENESREKLEIIHIGEETKDDALTYEKLKETEEAAFN